MAGGPAGGGDRRLRQQLDRRHRRRSPGGWGSGSSRSATRARGTPSARSSRTWPIARPSSSSTATGPIRPTSPPTCSRRSWRAGPTWSSGPVGRWRAGGDEPGPGAGQRPDRLGLPAPDRPGDQRPALGLPGLRPPLPRGRPPPVGRLRDRGRAVRPGRRPGAPRGRDPGPVSPGIAGTASKLRAFRDGRRILLAILGQSLRLRPWRPMLALAAPVALVGLAAGSWPTFLVGSTLAVAGGRPAGVGLDAGRWALCPLDGPGRLD